MRQRISMIFRVRQIHLFTRRIGCFRSLVRSIFIFVCVIYFVLTILHQIERSRESYFISRMNEQLNLWADKSMINLPGCKISYIDPDNKVILEDWFTSSRFSCGGKRHVFSTRITQDNRNCPELLEEVLWQDYQATREDIQQCFYSEVRSDFSAEAWIDTVALGEQKAFDLSACPNAELIWIKCLIKEEIYEQPLFSVHVRNRESSKNRVNKLNVLVIGIDALSRPSFHRTMKNTKRILREVFAEDAIELKGFNKVGLNSAPNQIPMLTGKRFRHEIDMNNGEFFEDFSEFIWDIFKKKGYETMFLEEQMKYGLFVYPSRKGFRRVPTDYWPRPLMIKRDEFRLKLRRSSGWSLCLGGEHVSEALLRYWLDLQQMNEVGLFSYVWLSESTHDDLTGGYALDGTVAKFFLEAQRRRLLNETIIFLLADHGYRIASFRDTPLGQLEDKLPFAFILLPKWFRNKFGEDVRRLEENSGRLTTPYDIHATLVSIANLQNGSDITQKRGLSLLKDNAPLERTCEDAAIDAPFCSCYKPSSATLTSEVTAKLMHIVVQSINEVLDKQKAAQCARLHSPKVTALSELLQNGKTTGFIQMSLTLEPASSRFEAIFKKVDGIYIQEGLPDRVDRFDRYSSCAEHFFYQKYCFCI